MTNSKKLALFVKNIFCYFTSGTRLAGSPGQSSLGATAAAQRGKKEASKQFLTIMMIIIAIGWSVSLCPSVRLDKGRQEAGSQPARRRVKIAP